MKAAKFYGSVQLLFPLLGERVRVRASVEPFSFRDKRQASHSVSAKSEEPIS
jgi:hypothetical protein